jgi:pimeloyl-ACP methyl ester carboxylesterase
MTSPRFHHFHSLGPNGFHRVAYTEWGDPANPHVVICVHGLTRNRRDFDTLAAALADRRRVVCMDVVGRGASDWLEQKSNYGFPLYLSDAAALIARVTAPAPGPRRLFQRRAARPGVSRVDWVGTSMGGLIGMVLASKPLSPIQRLVLNDVGPLIPWQGLARLKKVHGVLPKRFASLTEAESCLRKVCAEFGPLSDAEWLETAEHSVLREKDGTYVLAYDPAILSGSGAGATAGLKFGADVLSGVDLWPMWDAVKCRTLALRGGESDLLLASTAEQMAKRGPKARVFEFAGVGHAPWLRSPEQIEVVREFLLAAERSRWTRRAAGVKGLAA